MALHPESSVPLYIQLKELLYGQMRSGQYPQGARLPSERELAQSYNVSRMTARQALQLLAHDGLTISRVGKGTYVNIPPIHLQLASLTSFTEEMNRLGLKASSRVITAEVRSASPEIAENLQIPLGAEVVYIKRVRLADDMPLALETTHLVHALCPGILHHADLVNGSLYAAIRSTYHLSLVRAEQVFESRLPAESEAQLLNTDPNVPVLSIERTTYDSQNRVVEFVRSVYMGSHYRFRATLVSPSWNVHEHVQEKDDQP